MSLTPSLQEFQDLARDATLVPVVREFAFDTDTAVSAYHKLARPPVRLSAGIRRGRRDVGALHHPGHRAARCLAALRPEDRDVDAGGRVAGPGGVRRPPGRLRPHAPGAPSRGGPGAPPLLGRRRRLLRLRRRPADRAPSRTPPRTTAAFPTPCSCSRAPCWSSTTSSTAPGRVVAVQTEGCHEIGAARNVITLLYGARRADPRGCATEKGPAPLEMAGPGGEADDPFESTSTREAFEDGVRRIQEYIRAGDAFQVVLSQRLGRSAGRAPRSTCTARCARSTRRRTCSTWTWTACGWWARRPR